MQPPILDPRALLGPHDLGGGLQCDQMPGQGQAGLGLWVGGGAGGRGESGLLGRQGKLELPGEESLRRLDLESESQPDSRLEGGRQKGRGVSAGGQRGGQ